MCTEVSAWGVNPETLSAVATAVGVLVALLAFVIPAACAAAKARALSLALFKHDIHHLHVTALELTGKEFRSQLALGHRPSERQKRVLELSHVKEYATALALPLALTENVVQLIRQCEELRWRIDNLSNPDVDYENGTCMDIVRNRAVNQHFVYDRAEVVRLLAAKVFEQLYGCSPYKS